MRKLKLKALKEFAQDDIMSVQWAQVTSRLSECRACHLHFATSHLVWHLAHMPGLIFNSPREHCQSVWLSTAESLSSRGGQWEGA